MEPFSRCPVAHWADGLRKCEASLAESSRQLGITFGTLRAASVLGAPFASPLSRYLDHSGPVRVAGWDPPVQAVHYEDVLEALDLAAQTEFAGAVNIVGRGVARLSNVAARSGRVAWPLPAALVDRMDRTALGAARLRWRCIADGRLAKQRLGFHARYGIEEAPTSARS